MASTRQTQIARAPTPVTTQSSARILQRKCACGQHTIAGGECVGCSKQRAASLQRAATNHSHVGDIPPIVHDVLHSHGQSIDAPTRTFMESRFDHDFSHVRIHTDAKAAESAHSVNALAYTVGRDVVFGAGQYRPYTSAGRRLMAHELTHVVQQKGTTATLATQLATGSATGESESEADRISQLVVTGEDQAASPSASSGAAKEGGCKDGHWETKYDGCTMHWTIGLALGLRPTDNPALGIRNPSNPAGGSKDTRFSKPEDRTGACDKHDKCYQTCWPAENRESAKKKCDEQFHQDMKDACQSAHKIQRKRCFGAANLYHWIVKKFGQNAFDTDQKLVCGCEQK